MRDPLIGLAAHVGVRGTGSHRESGRAHYRRSGIGAHQSHGNVRGHLPGDIL
jgi:hypothetical protein